MADTTAESFASAPEAPAEAADNAARNRLVIALLLVSTFVIILNETIMSVALPRLMTDLDIAASAAQWLTTAFLLTMAVVIPVTGFLLQRLNTRPVFILAMSHALDSACQLRRGRSGRPRRRHQDGLHLGAVISLFAIAAAFFVKKPAPQPGMAPAGH